MSNRKTFIYFVAVEKCCSGLTRKQAKDMFGSEGKKGKTENKQKK